MAPGLRDEIRQLLAEHAGQRMDFVAIFMFLNTVAGGHYEERCSEEDLRGALAELLAAGEIATELEARGAPGDRACYYRLPPA